MKEKFIKYNGEDLIPVRKDIGGNSPPKDIVVIVLILLNIIKVLL